MFEITAQLIGMEVQEGADDHIVLISALGLQIPVPGTNQAMMVPAVILKTLIGRDAAIEVGSKLAAAGENLAEVPKSDIVVAQSLSGVDQAVQAEQRFRGGK